RMIPRCREENITFGYVILGTVADMEQPDSMTLGRLTDNLFMNALEACRQEGTERMIDFRLRAQENNMEIRLKNGIKESVLGTNPNLHTRKTETDRHGFGMESIWQIVETYHGTYEYWEEDGLFCQRIMLEFTGTVSNLEKI
ncbi:MAG: ATP-binding protein, partial [Lachnospiraceae bacterium]|nr:ATP-binding protein [Lachnospiraceae bacterium]